MSRHDSTGQLSRHEQVDEVLLKNGRAASLSTDSCSIRSDRRLRRDDRPVELNGRYLDALALLVREQRQARFEGPLPDRGVARRAGHRRGAHAMHQDASAPARRRRGRPRFIETVPKHGYRFIAPVEALDGPAAAAESPG